MSSDPPAHARKDVEAPGPVQAEALPTEQRRHGRSVPLIVGSGVAVLLIIGLALLLHARGEVNKVALAGAPKPVTTHSARSAMYRPTLRYVGTIEPWISAQVGPQYISAYVESVLVRPGAAVKRGQVLATLDCRNPSTTNKAIAQQAKAIAASQAAIQKEAERVKSLVDGGYASIDEAEMKMAESLKQRAQFQSLQAQTAGSQLLVSDCILRAPFDSEVADRFLDPGAFVHPGDPIASVVDRNVLRVAVDVPEEDFGDVAPGTKIHAVVLATGQTIEAAINRRAPAASGSTRTVHFEADVRNADRSIPSGTTAEVTLSAGKAIPSTEIPLTAASIKQEKAHLYVVTNGVAHARDLAVVGEREGSLFVDPSLEAGAEVVVQGQGTLQDGDAVAARSDSAGDVSEVKSASAQPAVPHGEDSP
jgi:RND family efflux transporter MFP subunit